jgi:hypothetical protein
VPFIVSVLLVSSTAVPWCANNGNDALRRPAATANTRIALFLMAIASIPKISFAESAGQSLKGTDERSL